MNPEKFQNTTKCVCDEYVRFEMIDEVECDWGAHVVVQCPKCHELFSVDNSCPAFHDVVDLEKNNVGMFSEKEKFDYTSNSHPV